MYDQEFAAVHYNSLVCLSGFLFNPELWGESFILRMIVK